MTKTKNAKSQRSFDTPGQEVINRSFSKTLESKSQGNIVGILHPGAIELSILIYVQ